MPFSSKKQSNYFHYLDEKDKLPKSINLHEWDKATDFKNLPEKKERFAKLKKKLIK